MKMSPLYLDLEPVSYVIGEEALEYSVKLLENFPRIIVLVDENVKKHCLPVLQRSLSKLEISGVICIKSGERNKTFDQAMFIWDELTRLNVDRDSILVNLGGGVISDIGGFVASTFKRGMHFINYPTTLIGMVDAAIGGKTGVDFHKLKNQVGLFADPVSVVIDPVFLKTLEEKWWQSGFSEVLKYGLIMDRELWNMLYGKNFKEIDDWETVITKAARIKIDIVRHDFSEKGVRKNLNFGHTMGHAFESLFLQIGETVTNGQAISAGMICEAWLSNKFFNLDDKQLSEVITMFDINFERLPISESQIPQILELMRQDKKVREGKLNFSLLKKIGKAIHNIEVPQELIVESLKFYINNR